MSCFPGWYRDRGTVTYHRYPEKLTDPRFATSICGYQLQWSVRWEFVSEPSYGDTCVTCKRLEIILALGE